MPDDQHPVTLDDGVEIPSPAEDELWTVGAVILNADGIAFAQKRSPHRRLFPDCWDIVGGHVEPGESLPDALAREIEEETGWRLRRIRRLLGIATWTGDDGGGMRHEADYLVEVDGDLDHPALEWSKHTAYAWFGRTDLPRLKQNRVPGEYLIHDLIAKAVQERDDSVGRLRRGGPSPAPAAAEHLLPTVNTGPTWLDGHYGPDS
ncbi:NUDIX domain-containing protein [Streptomyces sp. ASQP_92]|uniref:NUDIX hydrolase n=1 Tax=Streptomyces sp. ASQP_92 TaxID=2979116 RepID=UPI0021C10184|nr:NUDIX domain-containing protein [Streptomyces sp. ASQP_92]MCT9092557.1 NUDIX domain-containing protein [Streptomyces sp. ASQP_92]